MPVDQLRGVSRACAVLWRCLLTQSVFVTTWRSLVLEPWRQSAAQDRCSRWCRALLLLTLAAVSVLLVFYLVIIWNLVLLVLIAAGETATAVGGVAGARSRPRA